MKKVLLATAAMVAFTGAASAEVSITGAARFGLQYYSLAPAAMPKATLEKRITLNIDATTETDGGLELGARVRIRSEEAARGTTINGGKVYLKSGGFELAVGNVDGALESMPGVYSGSMGLTGNGYHNLVLNTQGANGALAGAADAQAGFWGWAAYDSRGLGVNGAEVKYSANNFTAHLSYDSLNDATAVANRIGLYLAYNFGDWTVALGMQDGGAVGGAGDKAILTVGGKLGDFGVGFAYADNNGTKKTAINGSYTMGATTLSAFIADEDTADVGTSFGVSAAYDLGGASLVGGVTRANVGANTTATIASAGIKFKF